MPTLRDLLLSYSDLSHPAQLDLILRLRTLRKTRPERVTKAKAKKAKAPVTLSKSDKTRIQAEAFLLQAGLPDDIRKQVLERMGLV